MAYKDSDYNSTSGVSFITKIMCLHQCMIANHDGMTTFVFHQLPLLKCPLWLWLAIQASGKACEDCGYTAMFGLMLTFWNSPWWWSWAL